MIGGFDTVKKNRIDRTGGDIIILVNNKIKYRRIADIFYDSAIEASAIEVFLEGERLVLVSCYRSPNSARE